MLRWLTCEIGRVYSRSRDSRLFRSPQRARRSSNHPTHVQQAALSHPSLHTRRVMEERKREYKRFVCVLMGYASSAWLISMRILLYKYDYGEVGGRDCPGSFSFFQFKVLRNSSPLEIYTPFKSHVQRVPMYYYRPRLSGYSHKTSLNKCNDNVSRCKSVLLAVNCGRFSARRREARGSIIGTRAIPCFSSQPSVTGRSGEILQRRGNVISITMINYERRLHESLTNRRATDTLSNSLPAVETTDFCAPRIFSFSRFSEPRRVRGQFSLVYILAAGSWILTDSKNQDFPLCKLKYGEKETIARRCFLITIFRNRCRFVKIMLISNSANEEKFGETFCDSLNWKLSLYFVYQP